MRLKKKALEAKQRKELQEAALIHYAKTQKFGKPFKEHFGDLNNCTDARDLVYYADEFFEAITQQNLISGKVIPTSILQSPPVKVARGAYLEFGGDIASFIASKAGTKDVFLTKGLFKVEHTCVFIGMPDNVEVSHRLFTFLFRQAKKAKSEFLQSLSKRIKPNNRSKRAKDYMYRWVSPFGYVSGSDELYQADSYDLLSDYSEKMWETLN